MTAPLYALFTATLVLPPDEERPAFDALVAAGQAVPASQGKLAGHRISPAGHRQATALWGHEQRESRP